MIISLIINNLCQLLLFDVYNQLMSCYFLLIRFQQFELDNSEMHSSDVLCINCPGLLVKQLACLTMNKNWVCRMKLKTVVPCTYLSVYARASKRSHTGGQ
jgi:hypothetical protein